MTIEIVGLHIEPDLEEDLPRWVRYAPDYLPPRLPGAEQKGGMVEASPCTCWVFGFTAGSAKEATRLMLRHFSDTAIGPLDWPRDSWLGRFVGEPVRPIGWWDTRPAEGAREALEEALKKYGAHVPGCDEHPTAGNPWGGGCTCGWRDARAALATLPEATEERDNPSADALDDICKIIGAPEWEYPGQVVRDVAKVVGISLEEMGEIISAPGATEERGEPCPQCGDGPLSTDADRPYCQNCGYIASPEGVESEGVEEIVCPDCEGERTKEDGELCPTCNGDGIVWERNEGEKPMSGYEGSQVSDGSPAKKPSAAASVEPEAKLYISRCGFCGAIEGTVDPNEVCSGSNEDNMHPHQFGVFETVTIPAEGEPE